MDKKQLIKEVDSLKKGDLIWVTWDYSTKGVYLMKFLRKPKSIVTFGTIVAVNLTFDETRKLDAYEDVLIENSSSLLCKPDWHTTPEQAYARVLTVTMQEMNNIMQKQQQAVQTLFPDS